MSEPGDDPSSGISLGGVLRRPKRHPACRRREAQPGSCTERENLIGDAKGKGASGSIREAESTDVPGRGGLLRSSDEAGVMPVERRERAIAIWLGSTGNGRSPMFNGRRQPSRDGTSRMTRECQVRFCEGLGVKFPGPTRQTRRFRDVRDMSGLPQTADISGPGRHFAFVPKAEVSCGQSGQQAPRDRRCGCDQRGETGEQPQARPRNSLRAVREQAAAETVAEG
jgi:hypothetical protein